MVNGIEAKTLLVYHKGKASMVGPYVFLRSLMLQPRVQRILMMLVMILTMILMMVAMMIIKITITIVIMVTIMIM